MTTERNAIAESGLALVFQATQDGTGVWADPECIMGDALRLYATSLSGFQKEAYVKSARTGRTWRLVSDEGANLNGFDAAPAPLGFFTAGLAASYMEEVLALATIRDFKIEKLRITVDNFYTMSGSMPKGTMKGGAQSVNLAFEIECPLTGSALMQFLTEAVGAAPQNGLVRGAHDSVFTLTLNGQELAPRRVTPMRQPVTTIPDAAWPPVPAVPEVVLLERIGMSSPSKTHPPKINGTAYSTTAPSARPLHVAAVAELRADRLKDIRQILHFPLGSEWRFLSEENSDRAPDANTLMAAGIGFCFMTQLGILAKAQKLDLPKYEIVQDVHLSLGGASGNTGLPSLASPVETHLSLTSRESVAKVCDMLDLAEQACFLHALCKTPLKTKLKILKIG